MKTISEIKTTYTNVSLKRICEELNLCYQYVLKASKKPISGVAYDADFFNDDEVNKILARKNVNLDDYDWSAISASIVTAEPINKIDDFKVDTQFTLREIAEKKGTVYTVIYTTETHVVFIAADSTQPRVMNFDTFAHQSPRIIR